MKTDLKVGQILFDWDLNEYEIIKIGNKYFDCKDCWRYKFEIETLKHKDKVYSRRCIQLYLTKQEIENVKEHTRLIDAIRNRIKSYGTIDLTLEQLIKIAEIINLK